MPKLKITKRADIGDLTISIVDGTIHVEGKGSLTASDWQRIAEELGMAEPRSCGHVIWYPYSSPWVTTGTPYKSVWTADTGTTVSVVASDYVETT